MEKITSQTRQVSCDGGKGADGHPMIYLYIGNDNVVVCPYCSREFHFSDTAES